jgi:TetR/AcrR family transcriptional repressor of nem operon
MARQLEFQDQEALTKAMHLFWEKGYGHCSVSDLLTAMNIRNGSFYNTFGSKKALFLKCLELYYNDLAGRSEKLFASSKPFKDKMRIMFRYPLDRQIQPNTPKGCFIINSVSADALEDKDILKLVRYYLDSFEAMLDRAIRDAQARGEVSASMDARNTAGVLNFYLQGLMKLCLLDYSNAKLREQTEVFLVSLGF